jgi:hypothetical protein
LHLVSVLIFRRERCRISWQIRYSSRLPRYFLRRWRFGFCNDFISMTAIARAKCGNCRCYVRIHCARRNAQLSRDLLRSTERCEKDTFPLTGGHRKPICASHGPRRPMLRTAPDVVLLPAQCLVASPQSAMVKNCTITDTMTSDSSSASRDCRMFFTVPSRVQSPLVVLSVSPISETWMLRKFHMLRASTSQPDYMFP